MMHPTPRIFRQDPSGLGKPWLILIHGLGLSHKSWTDPFAESLLDGWLSFDYVLTDYNRSTSGIQFPCFRLLSCSPPLRLSPDPPSSFWDVFQKDGHGLLTWSQEDPRRGISHAVDELQKVLEGIGPPEKRILIGHSRGGLIARRFMQECRPGCDRVTGLVLMGVPHGGSQIARLAKIFLRTHLYPGKNQKKARMSKRNDRSFGGLLRWLGSYGNNEGIEELVPRSLFLQSLYSGAKEERMRKIPYLNLIGTRTDFIRLYPLGFSPKSKTKPSFSLLGGFEKILPRHLVPSEIRQGRGDGLVSVESAHLAWALSNQFVPVNHAQFLVDQGVKNKIKQFIENL